MLLNNFYSIHSLESSGGQIKAALVIDREHDILKGHFPGQPVVPGVCMLQIIRELVEAETKQKLQIKEADQMKFLSIIDPASNNQVDANISIYEKDKAFSVTASLTAGTVTYFKLKAILQAHS